MTSNTTTGSLLAENIELKERLLFLEEIIDKLPGCVEINQVKRIDDQIQLEKVFLNRVSDYSFALEAIGKFMDLKDHDVAVNVFHAILNDGEHVRTLVKSRVFRRYPDGTPFQFLNWIVDLSRDMQSDQHISDLIREVHRLKVEVSLQKISKREKEVLGMISDGLSARMISEKLNISVLTVCTHRKNLLRKLNLHNIAALASFAAAIGI